VAAQTPEEAAETVIRTICGTLLGLSVPGLDSEQVIAGFRWELSCGLHAERARERAAVKRAATR
jgi:hypothetical protein